MADHVYTVEELATRWKIGPETVRRRVADGEIAAFRASGLIRIPASEVERIESGATREREEIAKSPAGAEGPHE